MTAPTCQRWVVDYRHFGIAKRRGSFASRKAADRAASEIYQTPGVTQVAIIPVGHRHA